VTTSQRNDIVVTNPGCDIVVVRSTRRHRRSRWNDSGPKWIVQISSIYTCDWYWYAFYDFCT